MGNDTADSRRRLVVTTMKPEICIERSRPFRVCNTCGHEGDDVKLLCFRWSIPEQRQGGGTAIALCVGCRGLTQDALAAEEPR